MERYARLKSELPAMAEIVNQFPSDVRGRAFDLMVGEFLGHESVIVDRNQKPNVPTPPTSTRREVADSGPLVQGDTIPGVAIKTSDGEVKLVFRDPKASSSGDAAKRIAYVTLRANELLTGQERTSSRTVVAPALANFRLVSGGVRAAVRADPGILRADDLTWLDSFAKAEADRFIAEIQNRELTGVWNPGAIRRAKKTRTGASEDALKNDSEDDEETSSAES